MHAGYIMRAFTLVRPAAPLRCHLRSVYGTTSRPAAPWTSVRCVHAWEAPVSSPEASGQEQQGKARLGKRKVAFYVGYEGSGYKGLQMNRHTAPDATIEDMLEQAIFKAGGILESNLGALDKLRWSRSSRTDKSVHSLSTVISMKLECDPESFVEDPEGVALAERINSFLPPEMRVFSVQRVTRGFSARAECIRRSYNYYLPASIIGLHLDGGAEDAERLARLAECWALFEGHHAFHNYTKRRLYRDEAVARGERRRKGDRRKEGRPSASEDEEEEGSEGDASVGWGSSPDSAAHTRHAITGSGGDGAEPESSSPAADGGSGASGSRSSGCTQDGVELHRGNKVEVRWNEERDARDPVVRRHYRYMEWCRCGGEVVPLTSGGTPCVLLSLSGGSFMLHQIRKMVAASVAVARGQLPLELVAASLAAPARVVLPLAPPLTLVLAGATFAPFRKSWDSRVAPSTERTGELLDLRPGGAALQRQFWEQTLLPAMDELLRDEEWARWEQDLEQLWYDVDEVQQVVSRHAQWQQEQALRKEARRMDEVQSEAQALENRAGEGAEA